MLEKSLAEEKRKLESISGASISEKEIAKHQKEHAELEHTIAGLHKDRDAIKARQAKSRSELEEMNAREEFLQKEKNAARIMESRLKNQLDEVFEAAKLQNTIESVDLSQPDLAKTLRSLRTLLKEKTELDDEDIESDSQIKQLESEYVKKMKDLQVKEEQFNQCVVIIPESDENAIRLTTEIQEMKNTLEARVG